MREPIRTRISDRQLDAVAAEIAQEKAASLRRSWDRLEAALAALRHHDSAGGHVSHARESQATERDRLVATASEALWYYVVQREACGLRDSEVLFRELDIPREVVIGMGCGGGSTTRL